MKVQDIKMLFAYNAWATNRVFESLARLPEDLYRKDLKASHGGIHGTMVHLVGAEKLWLSRWVGKPEMTLLQAAEISTLSALKEIWEDVASRMARFAARLDDQKASSQFEYATTEGKRNTSGYWQAFQHLVNHSTYHRGQIAALMRQMGAEPVSTDLISFYRHAAQPAPKR
jgi:uncharacterized damage-inducible protein DinB